ncbi:3535_t:CDS:1, partial [Entrophospora sp. SA101]
QQSKKVHNRNHRGKNNFLCILLISLAKPKRRYLKTSTTVKLTSNNAKDLVRMHAIKVAALILPK